MVYSQAQAEAVTFPASTLRKSVRDHRLRSGAKAYIILHSVCSPHIQTKNPSVRFVNQFFDLVAFGYFNNGQALSILYWFDRTSGIVGCC